MMASYSIWISQEGLLKATVLRDCRPFASRESAEVHAAWLSYRLATISGLGLRLEVRAGEERG